MKQKRKIVFTVVILLLFLVTAALLWYPKNYSTAIPPNFELQDSTTIGAGSMQIKIWDYSVVDDDTVNIIFDGKKIHRRLRINDTPVVYKAGFIKQGRHWIGVEALSEGSIGAATTHISIGNEKNIFEFDIEAHKDRPAYRLIIVK